MMGHAIAKMACYVNNQRMMRREAAEASLR